MPNQQCPSHDEVTLFLEQAVGGRPPRYAPTPLLPLGAEAPRAELFPMPNVFPRSPLQLPDTLRPR